MVVVGTPGCAQEKDRAERGKRETEGDVGIRRRYGVAPCLPDSVGEGRRVDREREIELPIAKESSDRRLGPFVREQVKRGEGKVQFTATQVLLERGPEYSSPDIRPRIRDRERHSDRHDDHQPARDHERNFPAGQHPDPDAQTVLHVGTGDTQFAVVAIDNDGDTAVHVGPVFSYYEFGEGGAKRLTDAEWQTRLRQHKAPARPAWITPHVVSGQAR